MSINIHSYWILTEFTTVYIHNNGCEQLHDFNIKLKKQFRSEDKMYTLSIQSVKPGMVIYEQYKTIYVDPDEKLVSKLEKNN